MKNGLLKNLATEEIIIKHFSQCNKSFVYQIESVISLSDYVRKIIRNAERYEFWEEGNLLGLIAAYQNDKERKRAFITNVSVLEKFVSNGIGGKLLDFAISNIKNAGFVVISLEVETNNESAIRLYKKRGFDFSGLTRPYFELMDLIL